MNKKVQSEATKEELQRRLRRVEGQVRGIQRMLEEDRDCRDILQQLSAVRSAVHNASRVFMQAYARECLLQSEDVDQMTRLAVLDEVMDLMNKSV